MYLQHFGLRESPFRITPHTEFFFAGANRGSTLEALIYAITHDEGIVKVTGEVGSGKTMLCRMLLEKLPEQVETVYLANPSLSRDEILYAIADELQAPLPEGRTHLLLRSLQERLLEIYAAGRQVVVLIDEAHAMPPETLEEIRLLSNLESKRHKLLQIVLFGQPELDHRLSDMSMRQLKERITHNFALEPLRRHDLPGYLMYRIRAAGYHGPDLFTPRAIQLISQASEGLTRRINILADKALLSAFSEGTHQIDHKQVKAAIRDAQFKPMQGGNAQWTRGRIGAAAAAAIMTIAGTAYVAGSHNASNSQGSPGSLASVTSSKPPPTPAPTVEMTNTTAPAPAPAPAPEAVRLPEEKPLIATAPGIKDDLPPTDTTVVKPKDISPKAEVEVLPLPVPASVSAPAPLAAAKDTGGLKKATPSEEKPLTPAIAVARNEPQVPAATLVAEAVPETLPPVMSTVEVETRAGAFLDEARRAMAEKELATAINRLNRVLGLPVSSRTEAAQALIGQAREMNGEILKAHAEYDLYLKLFPNGPSASLIRERLAALPKTVAAARAVPRPLPKEAGPGEWTYNGSIATSYYTGKSQINSLSQEPGVGGTILSNQSNLSLVDQSSLITSTNLNARRRDAFTDTRFVFRDTDNKNYLTPIRNYNRVYAFYVDHNDRKEGYSFRLGRQNPNGIGSLDRFDGLQAGYNINPQWRVNAVYGDSVEFNSPYKKSFYGASVDLLPQLEKPGISFYATEQTLDGLANRRALGTEVRYFDGRASAYGMLDYDVLYKGVNMSMMQGNYLDEGGNNYFLVLDRRKAPSYGLTTALQGAPGLTLDEMVAAQGLDAVRSQAAAMTPTSNMLSVGVTHPLSDNWQVGTDYRVSSITSSQGVVAVVPLATLGGICLNGTIDFVNNTCVFNTASGKNSGNTHVVTFQAIGSNLFFTNAIGVANLSLIEAPTYTGQATNVSYVLPLGDQWRIDTNLRFYTQKDNIGNTLDRFSPSIKLSYQWQNSIYLEGEIAQETSNSNGPTRTEKSQREYMYMGLRWDFH